VTFKLSIIILILIAGFYSYKVFVREDIYSDNSTSYLNLSSLKDSTIQDGDLYFEGNMNNVTITPEDDTELNFNGWDKLTANPYIEGIFLNNVGSVNYAFQEIKKDPTNNSINAMYAQSIDDDPKVSGTSRAQTSIVFKKGVNLPVYHTSHRMYLHPDIDYFRNYSSSITWFTVYEIWNEHISDWTGDGAGSARWSLEINKAKGDNMSLYWRIRAETMQPSEAEYKRLWDITNELVPIPLGKWFTLDLYMKRGEGSDGRMTIKITPDGETTAILFDVVNTTMYPGHPELQISALQPFKLYLDDTYLDWMRSNNKLISAYYNDFKWYKN
jgi:hypothetical protein